jgi:DNA/RNA-binding domain of Phe-tRNA-synthetase-like protein
MDISVGPDLRGRVGLGVVVLEGVTVREADAALLAEVEACCAELRAKYGEGKSAEVPGVADARTLYKAVGLDPTKHRPSNEALLRRALKGEPLYRINTLVDALNLASLRAQLPFGLYDLDRVEPPVVLRKGAAGEGYEGIRKGAVSVDGRPVLVDVQGPFGNPTSDSARTMITLQAKKALVVAYAPAGYGTTRLGQVLDATAELLTRHCGGREQARALV